MSRRVLIAAVLLVLATAGLYWWLTSDLAPAEDDGPLPTMPVPKPAVMATGQADAGRWMADRIAAAIADCAGQAAPRIEAADADGRAWRATGSATAAIRFDHHAWSPEDWLPLATAMAGPAAVEPGDEASSWAMVRALANPTVAAVLAADRQTGAILAAHRRDPEAWERAALVDAVLAFREAAGVMCDARQEIASACARLAWARALRPAPGPAGRVAAAIIETIAGRLAGTETAVAGWDADARLAPWARALRERVTGDWRTAPAAGATRIEDLAHARALAYHMSVVGMHDFIDGRPSASGTDVGRIACEGSYTIETGHRYILGALDEEFSEIAQVWGDLLGRAPKSATQEDVISTVNGQVKAATPRAVPPARWGAMLSRHLVSRLTKAHAFMQDSWGVPDQAAEFRRGLGGPLARIAVMPLVRMQIPQDPLRAEQAVAAAQLVLADPAWLTPGLHEAFQDAALAKARGMLPGPMTWWRDLAPTGTTWAACALDNLFGPKLNRRAERLSAIGALNPEDPWLRMHQVHVSGEKDPAKVAVAFGALADRDHWLAYHLAHLQQDDDAKVVSFTKLARMSPSEWSTVGEIESKRGHEAEAVVAYERFFTECQDRVSVANQMRWLVLWYASHGKAARAREIATDCYTTFSYRGIVTKALLDEQEGKLDDAAACYDALAERYGDKGDRAAFHRRVAKIRPASQVIVEQTLAAIFPGGMGEPVTVASFTGKPAAGMRVDSQTELSAKHRVTVGCIIVAIDGVRIRSDDQYDYVRAQSPGKPLDLIIWDGAAYRHIIADLPDRRFGIDLSPLTPTSDPTKM
jgi:hypothetical protein